MTDGDRLDEWLDLHNFAKTELGKPFFAGRISESGKRWRASRTLTTGNPD